MAIANAQQTITAAVTEWGGITAGPHRFGGVAYRLGQREIGHIHGDHLVDIPFPTAVRDELISTGQAEMHHILPDSGWVSATLRSEDDVTRALDMLQRSNTIAANQRRRKP